MIVFDASVWIAYLNRNDSQHDKATKAFAVLVGPLLLPEYILLEVYTVLVTRVDKTHADAFLRLVTDNRDVHVLLTEEAFFLTVVATCQERRRARLSFADVALLVLSKTHTVVTFDRALAKLIK